MQCYHWNRLRVVAVLEASIGQVRLYIILKGVCARATFDAFQTE